MSGRPKLCANCGKLMGVGDECPYCGADNKRLAVRLKRLAAAGEGGGLSVTAAFIVINLFMFATALVVGGGGETGGFDFLAPDREVLFRIGLQVNDAVDAGQWWRIITPVFLHMGVLHVVMNCYVLLHTGRLLEAEFGGRLMVFIYLAAGLLGFVGSYFARIDGGGASGAVMGVCGALLVRRRLVDGDFSHPATRYVLFLTLITAAFGLFSRGMINNVAHGVGFVTGAGLAFALTRVKLSRAGAAALMLSTWGIVGVTVVAAVLMMVSLFAGSPQDFRDAHTCWARVEQSVLPRLRVDTAERSLACLGDVARLEGPANAARDVAEVALRRALAAVDAGDAGAAELAASEVRTAVKQYAEWMGEALPRYGLRRR
jgi:rhomboid protease GluP